MMVQHYYILMTDNRLNGKDSSLYYELWLR